MSVVTWRRGGRRRADDAAARQSWADAMQIAQRNRAARVEWDRQCRDAVQRSGPAGRRVAPGAHLAVVVLVGVVLPL